MKLLILFLLLPIASLSAQSASQKRAADHAIRAVMQAQQDAWNRADLPAFMQGYWPSDSLRFIGSKGLTYGWKQTLANYQKSYPSADAMGKLSFTILSVEVLSKRSAFVIGKWQLARKTGGDLSGHYTLLWRKIGGQWLIVADHSS